MKNSPPAKLVNDGEARKISVSHLISNKTNKINHLVTIQPDARIGIAIALMKKYDISQLPVTCNDIQMGSVRETALMKKLSNETVANSDKVSEIMEPPLPTIDVDERITAPLNLLNTQNALAVTQKGKIIDIITTIDVINYLMNGVMS